MEVGSDCIKVFGHIATNRSSRRTMLRPRTSRMSSLAHAPLVILLTALVLSVGCKPEAAEPAPAVSANPSTKARFDQA
jgi:hypothetical protein